MSSVEADAAAEIRAVTAGSVWRVTAEPGALVAAGDIVLILESMKLEIDVAAPKAGRLRLSAVEGQVVNAGDMLGVIEAEAAVETAAE